MYMVFYFLIVFITNYWVYIIFSLIILYILKKFSNIYQVYGEIIELEGDINKTKSNIRNKIKAYETIWKREFTGIYNDIKNGEEDRFNQLVKSMNLQTENLGKIKIENHSKGKSEEEETNVFERMGLFGRMNRILINIENPDYPPIQELKEHYSRLDKFTEYIRSSYEKLEEMRKKHDNFVQKHEMKLKTFSGLIIRKILGKEFYSYSYELNDNFKINERKRTIDYKNDL